MTESSSAFDLLARNSAAAFSKTGRPVIRTTEGRHYNETITDSVHRGKDSTLAVIEIPLLLNLLAPALGITIGLATYLSPFQRSHAMEPQKSQWQAANLEAVEHENSFGGQTSVYDGELTALILSENRKILRINESRR
ncbi:hypothetical protein Pelo_14749 [Pelomyxa schiedti]|nr:hypothetical protein Pelo_14749 [Pelomyxa schiedti]